LKGSSNTKENRESLSKIVVEEKPIAFQGQARGAETKSSPNIRPPIVPPSTISHLAKSNNVQGDFASKGASLSKLNFSTSPACAKCKLTILNPREGGQFIGIPGIDENATPQIYHPECFKCAICDKPLNEPKKSHVTFVKCDAGPCHAQVNGQNSRKDITDFESPIVRSCEECCLQNSRYQACSEFSFECSRCSSTHNSCDNACDTRRLDASAF
jgi:hypothetical protein